MITVFSFVKPIVLFWSTKTRCSDQLREATWAETPVGDWGKAAVTLGYLAHAPAFVDEDDRRSMVEQLDAIEGIDAAGSATG